MINFVQLISDWIEEHYPGDEHYWMGVETSIVLGMPFIVTISENEAGARMVRIIGEIKDNKIVTWDGNDDLSPIETCMEPDHIFDAADPEFFDKLAKFLDQYNVHSS